MCCACQLIILFLLLLVMGHLWCFVFILCNLWADRTGSQSIMFGIVNTERFAALTLRSPVRSLRRHPISTLHSVSSKRCRRSSRHAKPRSERKRSVFTIISCMHNRRGIPRGMKQNNLLPGNMSLRQHVMWGNVSLRQHVIEAMCHVRQRVTWGNMSREAACHWGNVSVREHVIEATYHMRQRVIEATCHMRQLVTWGNMSLSVSSRQWISMTCFSLLHSCLHFPT